MGDVKTLRLVSSATPILGLMLLVTASIFLDDWRRAYELICSNILSQLTGQMGAPAQNEACTTATLFVASGGISISVALLQIGSIFLIYKKHWNYFIALQSVACVACIVAFALAMVKEGGIPPEAGHIRVRLNAMLVIPMLDAVLSGVLAIIIYFLKSR